MIALNNLARRTGWSFEDHERAVELSARGLNPAKIALALGRSEHGVKVVLRLAATRAETGAARKPRRCLGGCGALFASEGPHNRVCRGCSGRGSDLGEAYQLGRL